MKDWFRDNLYSASALMGSYDNRDDQYNLTIETADQNGTPKAYTVSYTEKKRGWVSFKSFITQDGISHKNTYYTFPSNKYSKAEFLDPWEKLYSVPSIGHGDIWEHSLDLRVTRLVEAYTPSTGVLKVNDDYISALVSGMLVEGNGVPADTVIDSVICSNGSCSITLKNLGYGITFLGQDIHLNFNDKIKFTAARNNFYGNDSHYSMVKVLFNGDKGTVKRFKTLDYEGTQAKINFNTSNANLLWEDTSPGSKKSFDEYRDNWPKLGWSVNMIKTDLQEGKVIEFINKENKWFNNIVSFAGAGVRGQLRYRRIFYTRAGIRPTTQQLTNNYGKFSNKVKYSKQCF